MARSRTPPLTPPVNKFRRYLLSFVVTFGVGISPLLGAVKIPLFRTILDAYPKDLQDVIPWASLLMSATAVAVHFYSSESKRPRFLRPAFVATFAMLVVLIFVSYAVYAAFVIRIEVPAAHEKVAYLAGSTPLPTCECAKRGLA